MSSAFFFAQAQEPEAPEPAAPEGAAPEAPEAEAQAPKEVVPDQLLTEEEAMDLPILLFASNELTVIKKIRLLLLLAGSLF